MEIDKLNETVTTTGEVVLAHFPEDTKTQGEGLMLTFITENDPINVNPENPIAQPFLLLKVNEFEGSNVTKRKTWKEYDVREPVCVKWNNISDLEDKNSISLIVTNLGDFASDAIRIHYQFVYCTSADHRRDEGFTTSHALEASSDDKSFYVDFVPARSERSFSIPFPIPTDSVIGLENLYFRARISTLWQKVLPFTDWDFGTDLQVTEATKVF